VRGGQQAFAAPVPKELLDYIGSHKDTLHPLLRKAWEAAGSKTSGTWEEVFGKAPYTDELFMAWNYASYVNRVAAAGKAEYPLPMYVNTRCSMPAPDRPPGTYPSGGPEPQVQNIWKAAAPAIDIRSPDLYSPNFPVWVEWYRESYAPDDPLFIPETDGTTGAYHVFYALGQHDGMGFSPFAIDELGLARHRLGHRAGGPAAGAELRHAGATRPGDSGEPGQRQDGRRGGGRG
jgi:hypothetical protein